MSQLVDKNKEKKNNKLLINKKRDIEKKKAYVFLSVTFNESLYEFFFKTLKFINKV